ncbi:hypothetical protein ES703_53282 [subsurface metagenome]
MFFFYRKMGRYDEILIVEGPSDAVAATLALSAGSEGNVRTETLKAFPEAEYRNIIAKIP